MHTLGLPIKKPSNERLTEREKAYHQKPAHVKIDKYKK
jgi:hypothetical protein